MRRFPRAIKTCAAPLCSQEVVEATSEEARSSTMPEMHGMSH